MRPRAAVGLVLVSLLAMVTIMSAQDNLKNFKALYEQELKQNGVVGSSFVFLRNNKRVADHKYGLANAETRQPVDENTIYHWASNTKPFTGIAIMQLRDRGLLKLDDPVTKYLPELRAVHNPFGSMDEISIRHLMTHSAGFRGGTWPWGAGKDWEPFEPQHYEQLVAMFPYTDIRFKPGSKFSYSNPGIIFLGRIIELLTKDDYEVYIDKNILKPLEMYRSYFDATPYHLLKHRSHSYYIRDGKRQEGRFDANTGVTVSNSGLNSPVSDMVKYLNFLVGDQAKHEIYDGVLKRSSLEEMWQPQLKAESDANGNKGFTTDIGLIFFLDRSLSKTHLGHGGDQNGFISYLDFDPAKREASLLVLNTDVVRAENTSPDNDMVAKLRKAIRALY
ncbi:MAG: serine hydrolase domain-containing protein [Pyrinomonadaceae bacterium]